MDKLVSFTNAPNWLRQGENQRVLADEIKYLLENTQGNDEGRAKIKKCAIAKSCGGNFDTPETLFKTDKTIREIFQPLGLDAYFVGDNNAPVIANLTEDFSIRAAIKTLETCEDDTFFACLEENPERFVKLINWLVNECLNADNETKGSVRNLKIWLSGGKLSPLNQLVVPGDFSDPLHLASIVDLETLKISSEKLIEIGARRLTFHNYVTKQLPGALRDLIEPNICRQLVELFAEKRVEIYQDEHLQKIIASLPIIECQDGKFRAANSIYFANDETKCLLGTRVSYVNPTVTT